MKRTIFVLAVTVIFIIFVPGCKNGFVWNPVGSWSISFTGSWGDAWFENLNFTGSETGGMISGWTFFVAGTPGTWTKTGDFTINFSYDFPYDNDLDHLEFTGTSSEASPNSMAGTGTWYFYLNGVLEDTYSMTFNGIKTSNLQ